jgi:uncharacterized protein (TIGR02284 family)
VCCLTDPGIQLLHIDLHEPISKTGMRSGTRDSGIAYSAYSTRMSVWRRCKPCPCNFLKGIFMNDDLISTLNDLIETCKDGENGFKTCAEDIGDGQFKQPFQASAAACATAAQELQALVVAHGGTPQTKSSLSGTLHRRWVDIKSAITGKDDEAILAECERGEDMALKSYRRALEKDLPADVLLVVERQYQGAIRNHDMVKSLRDRAHVAAH